MAGLMKKLLLRIFERPLQDLTDADRRYAEDLRREITECPLTLSESPTEAELAWHRFNEALRVCAAERDPREFLRWDVIRGSMFISNPSYVAREYRYLKALPDWRSRWKPAVNETAIGRPRPYPRYPKSSGNLIHHAYHVARFEAASGVRVNELDQVFEFGGGYGSMARLFFQLGYGGNFLIYDFPYFSALQRFFLRSIGYTVCGAETVTGSVSQDAQRGTICCVSELERLRGALQQEAATGKRLFLATWSISESPLAVREQIWPLVTDFAYFLIAFQHQFEDIDNSAYFQDWVKSMGDGYRWQLQQIEHLPASSYLLGWRKDS